MKYISREDLPDLFACIAATMTEEENTLCIMDARLGDGDLGLTMKKGFCALPEIIRGLPETDVGRCIVKAGMKLSSIVPSTMGFLMSAGLMAGGKAISGASSIGAAEFSAFLRGFADGIVNRGKCAPGDRTVLDAIDSAAKHAEACLHSSPGATLEAVASAAQKGASEGAEATRSMEPRFGKAAVHKDAAIGTIDQGAYAGLCVISSMRKFIDDDLS